MKFFKKNVKKRRQNEKMGLAETSSNKSFGRRTEVTSFSVHVLQFLLDNFLTQNRRGSKELPVMRIWISSLGTESVRFVSVKRGDRGSVWLWSLTYTFKLVRPISVHCRPSAIKLGHLRIDGNSQSKFRLAGTTLRWRYSIWSVCLSVCYADWKQRKL